MDIGINYCLFIYNSKCIKICMHPIASDVFLVWQCQWHLNLMSIKNIHMYCRKAIGKKGEKEDNNKITDMGMFVCFF